MITVRKANTLNTLKDSLRTSIRSFSNNSWYDPKYMGVKALKVINDDSQKKGGQIPTHFHSNTEIVSYQVAGLTKHVDSLGNTVEDGPGAVYLMSSGKGILHSEENVFNGDSHYIQIWFTPTETNTAPTFTHTSFTTQQKTNTMLLLAAPHGAPLILKSHAKLFAGIFTQDHSQRILSNHTYYLYVVAGSITVNGNALALNDAATITSEKELTLTAASNAEVLFFQL